MHLASGMHDGALGKAKLLAGLGFKGMRGDIEVRVVLWKNDGGAQASLARRAELRAKPVRLAAHKHTERRMNMKINK